MRASASVAIDALPRWCVEAAADVRPALRKFGAMNYAEYEQ
jgi:hypothetical protein